AFRGYGHPGNLSELERTRWRERLDYEAGLLQRGPAQIPLPPRASEATLRVGRGWQLLVGLRDPEIWPADEPFVYARRFVMAWAEVTNQEARRGVEQLEEFGSMVRVGRHPSGPILWRPGPTFALVHGSVEAGEHAAIEAVKAAFVAEELDA